MNPTLRKGLLAVASTLLAVLLVAGLSLLTNSLDTTRFSWDFRYYIGMAQHPFAPPEASPFAYRYATPLLVWGISNASALSTEGAFRAVAYAGAILQLLGVFLFVWWLTRSAGGAYLALVVTAFSLFNVKFLLFDIYRPDHLAFAFILLQTYFALKRQYWPLLLSTAVAVQVREFNIAPLIAYLFILWSARREEDPARQRARVIQETLVSTLALILAFGVPRLLIPVAEDYQFASLTRDGLLRVLLAPFILPRDANFVYSVAAYLLAQPHDCRGGRSGLGACSHRYVHAALFAGLQWHRPPPEFSWRYGFLPIRFFPLPAAGGLCCTGGEAVTRAPTSRNAGGRFHLQSALASLSDVGLGFLPRFLRRLRNAVRLGERPENRGAAGVHRCWHPCQKSFPFCGAADGWRPLMIDTGDFIAAEFSEDLTAAGISLSREGLSRPRGGGPERAYVGLRREIAAVAVALAFRRHLSHQGISYRVARRRSFDSSGVQLLVGGNRCSINSYLISHPDQIAALESDPGLALTSPALIPANSRWALSSPDDLHIFAVSTGSIAAPNRRREGTFRRPAREFLVHLMPSTWARPEQWIRIGPLVLKSESREELAIELGGQNEAGEFLTRPVRLDGGIRREVEAGFWSLTHVHARARPAGRIGISRKRGTRLHVIDSGDWRDVWIRGRMILFLGWMRHLEFRGRAKKVPAGSRVFQFSRTRTPNLAVPMEDLKPLDQLLESLRRSSAGS